MQPLRGQASFVQAFFWEIFPACIRDDAPPAVGRKKCTRMRRLAPVGVLFSDGPPGLPR